MRRWPVPIILLMLLPFYTTILLAQDGAQDLGGQMHFVRPGDTWTALSYYADVSPISLIKTSGTINPQQQPVIGSHVLLHERERTNGQLVRPFQGGFLEVAVRQGRSPWKVALQNNRRHPYSPILYAPVFIPGGNRRPRELPFGFEFFSISDLPAQPGQALGLQARSQSSLTTRINLDDVSWKMFWNGDRLLALGATGAFYGAGTPELRVQVEQHPLWTQPWLFVDKEWTYDQVSFAETAATEQEAMRLERARLQRIWEKTTPEPLWASSFSWPLKEYVALTSHYGARRSVDGGPYDTYHEGTDFSAYRGTPVYAPAAGKVVLAESLTVRGGSVIINHGLGIHTGYYHLSEIHVLPGDDVNAGDLIAEVGSTGRSTGNHLHWDLLVGTTWVDAEAWMSSNLAGWIRNGWGSPYPNLDNLDMPPKS